MPTEQFKFDFGQNHSSEPVKPEDKRKIIEEKPVEDSIEAPHSFYPISEDERQDDQPRYGH